MTPIVGTWTLIDLAVIAGVAVVLPVGLGRRWWWWVAAVGCAGATATQPGTLPAVLLALVWPVVAVAMVVDRARHLGPVLFWRRADLVRLVASGYATVAATWFVLSCAGATPLGIDEPIVELTAVHFTFVGVGALVLADAALDRAVSRCGHRLGWVALGLTGGAPVVVASGFTLGWAVLQVGGAVLMSIGVFATAALQLADAARGGQPAARLALAVSGLAIWAPMVLAVAWATSQHVAGTPALSTADMVPAHGAVNAVAFIGAGLLGRWLQGRRVDRSAREEVDHGACGSAAGTPVAG
jgi:hypothetical protein